MADTRIITISREYGSGGREIGEMVAKRLGVPFYDKVLIDMIAQESGMAAGYVEEASEKMTTAQAFNISTLGYYSVSPNYRKCSGNRRRCIYSSEPHYKGIGRKGIMRNSRKMCRLHFKRKR